MGLQLFGWMAWPSPGRATTSPRRFSGMSQAEDGPMRVIYRGRVWGCPASQISATCLPLLALPSGVGPQHAVGCASATRLGLCGPAHTEGEAAPALQGI